MEKIDRFEKLVAWQKARDLTKQIYVVTRKEEFRRDFGLTNQIQRAAVSIMSNIAEGFDRGGRAEFHQFLSTAKASAAEVRSQLYVALDAGYVNQVEFENLMQSAHEVSRIIGALRMAVEKQRDQIKNRKGTESLVPSPEP
jgi:four helix bundle protein